MTQQHKVVLCFERLNGLTQPPCSALLWERGHRRKSGRHCVWLFSSSSWGLPSRNCKVIATKTSDSIAAVLRVIFTKAIGATKVQITFGITALKSNDWKTFVQTM